MDSLPNRSWGRIRQAILSRWGHHVNEDDLATPMTHKELCDFFGERCSLERREAKEEANRILNEVGAGTFL